MRKSRFTEEQIIAALKRHAAGRLAQELPAVQGGVGRGEKEPPSRT